MLVSESAYLSVKISENLAVSVSNKETKSYKIIKGFGLEGTFKILEFQPPAMGRVSFH